MQFPQVIKRVDVISLYEVTHRYAGFLRSVRMLRGAAGVMGFFSLFFAVLLPATLIIAWFAGAPGGSFEGLLFPIGMTAGLAAGTHIYLYAFRTVAAGSKRSAVVMLVFLG